VRFLRWPLRILGLLALVYTYFATLHPRQRVPDHPFFRKPGPWAIAHRGGRGLWPENTVVAFEKAHALGVDVIEMDLRVTADGVIVVMHDARVDRTTNGTGRVDQMELSAVRKFDAGYRFKDTEGRFAFRGQGLVVPTFEEILTRFPKSRLNIEMKQFTERQAVALCSLLQSRSSSERFLVASFDQAPMSAFRRACPTVATSATTREALAMYILPRLYLGSLYRGPATALQVPPVLRGREIIGPRLIEASRSWNVQVEVWTVNEEGDMKRLLQIGVQGILTDYPDRLLRLLGRSGADFHPDAASQPPAN
jgi:glycerophosphoryl diester phosphodiesterase